MQHRGDDVAVQSGCQFSGGSNDLDLSLGFRFETEQAGHSFNGNCAGVGEIEGRRQRYFVSRDRRVRHSSRKTAGGRIRRNKNRKKTAGKSTFLHAWQIDMPLSGTLKKRSLLAGF